MALEAAEARAGESSHARYLLRRIAEEAQRALELDDPMERARVIATLIQPYSGWALREAVLDLRDTGARWSRIAPDVALSQAVLARQVRGAGPVVTIAPSYSPLADHPGTPAPLHLAATALVRRMTELAATESESPTAQHLCITVMALGQGLTAGHPGPLAKTVDEVLRVAAGAAAADRGLAQTTPSDLERSVWAAIDELRTAYDRGRGAIRMAAVPVARVGEEA